MLLEVVKAFSLEHIRWLTPLQEYALREVKGASVEGGRVEPDTRRLYDSVTEFVRDGNYWILCDCLSDGSERPVTVPSRGPRGIRLGNLPNAQVPHDGDCVFRLREASQGTSGYFFNPLLHERYDAHSTKRDPEQETWRRTGRSVPPVAYVLKCFIREARLHTLAGVERSGRRRTCRIARLRPTVHRTFHRRRERDGFPIDPARPHCGERDRIRTWCARPRESADRT